MGSSNMTLILAVLVAAVLALLLLPQATPVKPVEHQPEHWTIQTGAEAMDGALQAMRFMPDDITIHVGDSVTWDLGPLTYEEHTIYLLADGEAPALIYQGADERFYFEASYFIPSEVSEFDGSTPISGGVLSTDQKTFTVTYTEPGDFKYICGFHPGMEGVVHVVPADQPLPHTPAEYAAMAQKVAAQTLESARALHERASHYQVSPRSDGSHEHVMELLGDQSSMATLMDFVPNELHIEAGDTVTWNMMDMSEVHTVTFADDAESLPELVMAEPQPDGPPLFVAAPEVVGVAGGSVHTGPGYYNSGFLLPMPGEETSSYSLTFSAPGSFEYWCVIHPSMHGKIVVEQSFEQALEENNRRFMEASNRRDAAAVAQIYAEDARLLPPNEPMQQGREKIEQYWQILFETFQSVELTLNTLNVHKLGDTAVEVGAYTFLVKIDEESPPINDTGKFVTIWRREEDGIWRLITDIWNSDMPPPMPAPEETSEKSALQAAVFDAAQLAEMSEPWAEGLDALYLAGVPTGVVAWARLDGFSEPMHYNTITYFIYALSGEFTLRLPDGTSSAFGAGQFVAIPAGVAQSLSGSGDLLYLATPPETLESAVILEGPDAVPGAEAPSSEPVVIQSIEEVLANGLEMQGDGFSLAFLGQAETGSVELIQLETGVAMHRHPQGNEVLYILKGHGTGQIGGLSTEVAAGQVLVIPAGVAHKLERLGDEPLVALVFSTPAFHEADMEPANE